MRSGEEERDAIEEQAAGWLARRDRGFAAEAAAAFTRWRMMDPRHDAAAAELALVWGALDDLSASNRQQRAGDVAAAPPAPAAAEPVPAPAGATCRQPSLARWWPALGLAAALALVAGMSLSRRAAPPVEAPARYETAVGAQRAIALPDGSELRLNTDTAVTMRLGAGERRVKLERGEAFFQVAKDAARPFIVAAGSTEARVLGTAFVVRLREGESEVLVTEGHVKFGATGAAGTELHARQHAVLALGGGGTPRVETLDAETVARRLAWQSGRLEFKNTPLREAVAEFNRYHREKIVLRDAATEAVLVGGPFAVDNLDGFVRLLDKSFDVMFVRRDADQIVLGLRP